jgi:hypothetical protein
MNREICKIVLDVQRLEAKIESSAPVSGTEKFEEPISYEANFELDPAKEHDQQEVHLPLPLAPKGVDRLRVGIGQITLPLLRKSREGVVPA